MPTLTRAELISCVRRALEPQAFVHCLWEGGSAGFARTDQWSDVDLQCEVDDDKVCATFDCVEAALAEVSEVLLRFLVPEPTWHGHSQRFYRFANAEPCLMLDFAVIKRSATYKFNEPEVHGKIGVLFDRSGLFGINVVRTDRSAYESRLRGRIEMLRTRVAMFGILVEKEGRRGHAIDALHFYEGLIIAPLVELLRIKHDPIRHNWGNRYLHGTLPPAEAKRLEKLMYVGTPRQIEAKQKEATAWIEDLASELTTRAKLV